VECFVTGGRVIGWVVGNAGAERPPRFVQRVVKRPRRTCGDLADDGGGIGADKRSCERELRDPCGSQTYHPQSINR